MPLPSDHLSSQHLLQDLYPSAHCGCVCQQPKGLHTAKPEEACGPADQQWLANHAGGPIRVVPTYGEQQLEAVL